MNEGRGLFPSQDEPQQEYPEGENVADGHDTFRVRRNYGEHLKLVNDTGYYLMDRLHLLIGVADQILEEQKRAGHLNVVAAVVVAALIDRELHTDHVRLHCRTIRSLRQDEA